MNSFPYDEEKAVSAVAYILQELKGVSDFHKLFKILYFADQKHMVKYGRPVIGDVYIAMENGPVPSTTYNAVKQTRRMPQFSSYKLFAQSFTVRGFHVTAKQAPDMDELSKSDIDCLNKAISECRGKNFGELTHASHKFAYNNVAVNSSMNMLDIAKEGGAVEPMVEYITENAFDHHISL